MKRGAGILLHIASLPGGCYIGDLGPEAFRFVDSLRDAGQTYWQTLPINHANPEQENSPYSPISSFAGDPVLISLEKMVQDRLLDSAPDCPPTQRIDYEKARQIKIAALKKSYEKYKTQTDFKHFKETTTWLDHYAYYAAMREKYGPWPQWPRDEKPREEEVDLYRYAQFIFWLQWKDLKQYANDNGVFLIGDLPIYVDIDSADVWKYRKYFKITEEGKPLYVGGVPPDYYSSTGQLWGQPVFNWEELEKDGFKWWIERLRHALAAFDYVRLDHFRGYVAYWEIPAGMTTADGKWQPGPGLRLFMSVYNLIDRLIAEDLGYITPDVEELRKRLGIPGMRVLQLSWDGNPANDHKPHNYDRNIVAYTSTHDSNTTVGWFLEDATPSAKDEFLTYTNCREEVNWCAIRVIYMSVANVAIVPMQDVLGLGSESRMNRPGTRGENWRWKLNTRVPTETYKKLKQLAYIYYR